MSSTSKEILKEELRKYSTKIKDSTLIRETIPLSSDFQLSMDILQPTIEESFLSEFPLISCDLQQQLNITSLRKLRKQQEEEEEAAAEIVRDD